MKKKNEYNARVLDSKARHEEAMRNSRPGHERALVGLYRGLAEYADAYRKLLGGDLGDDGVIGNYWRAMGSALQGLLNGETGRLDCGTFDRLVGDLMRAGGDEESVETARAATSSGKPFRAAASTPYPPLIDGVPLGSEPRVEQAAGERRLTDRERELLACLTVDQQGRAVFDPSVGHVPDWSVLKKVVLTLGGRWVKKSKGVPGHFAFAEVDASDALRAAKLEGRILDPRTLDFYETPPELADELVFRLNMTVSKPYVLEPSAGRGSLVHAIFREKPQADVVALEMFEGNRRVLSEIKPPKAQLLSGSFELADRDFLYWKGPERPFDHVVMNPPFSGRRDVQHITRAIEFLRPGGTLVAVASAGVVFRQDKLSRDFRDVVHSHGGTIEDLPEGSFEASGTGVRTVVVRLEKKA